MSSSTSTPYHGYLGYYAAVKLRDQYGGTPEAESVFTRFVAQAGGDTFSTSEAGRILRSVFGGVSGARQGKGRGRGRGRGVSPDAPPAGPESSPDDVPISDPEDTPEAVSYTHLTLPTNREV